MNRTQYFCPRCRLDIVCAFLHIRRLEFVHSHSQDEINIARRSMNGLWCSRTATFGDTYLREPQYTCSRVRQCKN
jgi:hypothetical protein